MKNIYLRIVILVIMMLMHHITSYSQNTCATASAITIGNNTHCFDPSQIDINPDMSSATGSGVVPGLCGAGGANVDYWYIFTSPAVGNIQVAISYPTNSSPVDIVFYSGTCGTLSEEVCVTGQDYLYGQEITLTPSTVYYLQVLNDGSDSNPGVAEFCLQQSICGEPTIANDVCGAATELNIAVAFSGSTACTYTVDIFGASFINDPAACGAATGFVIFEGNGWYTFEAAATDISLDYDISNCSAAGTSAGVEVMIWDVVCTSIEATSPIYCTGSDGIQQGSGTINLTGLTIGNDYVVMVDGVNGTNCFYSFTPGNGVAVQTSCNANSGTWSN